MSKFMTLKFVPVLVAVIVGSTFNPACAEQLLVVAHPESMIGPLSREQVAHVFLGRLKRLPNGEPVTAVEVESLREPFYRWLIGRDISEINAYWARLRFSGRTQPPPRLPSSKDALAVVLADRNAVTYVEAEALDPRAKVLWHLEP